MTDKEMLKKARAVMSTMDGCGDVEGFEVLANVIANALARTNSDKRTVEGFMKAFSKDVVDIFCMCRKGGNYDA
jgi:hypothetical protein